MKKTQRMNQKPVGKRIAEASSKVLRNHRSSKKAKMAAGRSLTMSTPERQT